MEQGEVIRKLRIERGMSQNMLSKGISTRTTLSSFELRQTRLSSPILIKYLNKLNVKFDEFQFLVQDSQLNDKELISNKFLEIVELGYDRNELLLFIKQLNNMYEVTRDNFYSMIASQLIILKESFLKSNESLVLSEKKKIKNYLFTVENWCHFELSIFSNLLFIFSSEEIVIQFDNAISKMWVLKDLIQYNNLISTFLINGCLIGFERKDATLLNLFLTYLETVSDNHMFIETKIYAIIFKGLKPIVDNDKCDSLSIDKGVSILETLNRKKADKIKQFIVKILKS